MCATLMHKVMYLPSIVHICMLRNALVGYSRPGLHAGTVHIRTLGVLAGMQPESVPLEGSPSNVCAMAMGASCLFCATDRFVCGHTLSVCAQS